MYSEQETNLCVKLLEEGILCSCNTSILSWVKQCLKSKILEIFTELASQNSRCLSCLQLPPTLIEGHCVGKGSTMAPGNPAWGHTGHKAKLTCSLTWSLTGCPAILLRWKEIGSLVGSCHMAVCHLAPSLVRDGHQTVSHPYPGPSCIQDPSANPHPGGHSCRLLCL